MQNPEKYRDLYEQTTHRGHLLELLKEHEHLFSWGPDEVVLDAGCGPGDVTAKVLQPWLPDNFRLLLGIDVSAAMVQHALSQHFSHKVTFAISDIDSEISQVLHKFNSCNGFDKIFSFYALHWLSNIEGGIKSIHSIMKQGGQLFLVFPVDRLFQQTFKRVCNHENWKVYFKDIARKVPSSLLGPDPCGELRDMMIKAGFEVMKCDIRKVPSSFDSIKILKDLVESLDPHISCVPPSLKSKYLDDCLQVLEDMKALTKDGCSAVLKQSVVICLALKT